MKTILGFLFISILLSRYKNQDDSSKLLWSADKKLEWKDFVAQPQHNVGASAETNWYIGYKMEGDTIEILCCFIRNKSWVINKKVSDEVLKHEQYHFNIAEVYARILRKHIFEFGLGDFETEYAKIIKNCNTTQDDYDKDSNHSKFKHGQETWEKFVDKKLIELNDYSRTKVIHP